MHDYIDREFEQLHCESVPGGPAAPTAHTPFFGRMLLVSLLLHLALTPLAFLPGKRSGGIPFSSLISVDLESAPSLPPLVTEEPPVPRQAEAVLEVPTTLPQAMPEPATTVSATEAEHLQEKVREAVSGGQSQPELLEQSSLGLGLSLGYFSSLAEGRTLKDDIREYYFAMLRKVNEKWWLTGAQSLRTPRIPLVTVVLARNGEMIERVLEQSSGNREYDNKILQALDAAGPFPPLPDSFRMPYFKAPLRLVAPLNLMVPPGETPQSHS